MTEEQRSRLDELLEKQRISERKKEARLLEERLAEEIPEFSEKYVFADDEQTSELCSFNKELHSRFAGNGIEGFDRRKSYSESADGRRVWMEFFLGGRDIFRAYVGGRAENFIADLEDWMEFDPFDVLALDDLSGFLYIDRRLNITEVTI